ncbi:glycosyltransferase family 2 protein [Tropicimonas sp. TH_r6]|uniref:glycosyltransferase family 2 protein n=1 Tax=Tropicimonas sp. TH_r6 TaxID=3082085 RepID=UPI002955A1BA|nr:glycosyltransferase family 2 protein [Tropicimonas sp. TH_r6]MDV7141179.1 glycosyltransferase family 2 protein [Tropicimonas sp. TH_r6]
MGRNIAYYIPVFMEHYRALGMRYLVYLDNGSDDGSIEVMQRYGDVITLHNKLNFRDFQRHMRMHMAREYAVGGWRLAIDADEILRYPGEARLDLRELCRRLETRGMTGLLAQMLEMVPDGPLETVDALPFESALRTFRRFSLGNLSAYRYHDPEIPLHPLLHQNGLSDPDLRFLYGGLRRTLFSEDCCLSKHVLFRDGPEVTPLPNPHVTTGLHMADFTALLQHYKFSGGFLARERRRQAERRLSHNETELRLAAFARNPQMSLTVADMQSDPTPTGLLEAGFLQATEDASRMLGL